MNLFSTLALTLASFGPAMLPAQDAPIASTTEAVHDVRTDRIVGLGTDSWSLTLGAGMQHMIVVNGDGSSDLDAYLFDQNGNLVAADDDLTDFCLLLVTPIRSGSFTLVIQNRGIAGNSYSITLD